MDDKCFYPRCGMGEIAAFNTNNPDGIYAYVIFEKDRRTIRIDDPDLLWIPPVYSDDERCLWKMAARGDFLHVYYYSNGEVMIRGIGIKVTADTLPEALLRAIADKTTPHNDK